MAGMRRNVDTTWAEFLLRPLSSGALNLEAFPDEAIARICTTERLKTVFPLVVRAQHPEPAALQSWTTETGLVMGDHSLTAEVVDVILRAEVRGNRQPQLPGQAWPVPQFSLFVTAGRVSLAFGWDVFSALVRYMKARAWLGATHEWSARDSLVSLYIPRGDGNMAVLGLDGVHIAMSAEEYLALEAEFLAAVMAPDVAPVLAELRCIYGDV